MKTRLSCNGIDVGSCILHGLLALTGCVHDTPYLGVPISSVFEMAYVFVIRDARCRPVFLHGLLQSVGVSVAVELSLPLSI